MSEHTKPSAAKDEHGGSSEIRVAEFAALSLRILELAELSHGRRNAARDLHNRVRTMLGDIEQAQKAATDADIEERTLTQKLGALESKMTDEQIAAARQTVVEQLGILAYEQSRRLGALGVRMYFSAEQVPSEQIEAEIDKADEEIADTIAQLESVAATLDAAQYKLHLAEQREVRVSPEELENEAFSRDVLAAQLEQQAHLRAELDRLRHYRDALKVRRQSQPDEPGTTNTV